MILSKPNAIVYFRRDNLIVAGKHVTPARLNITPDILHNLEVLQPEKFVAGCQDFFAAHDLKGKRVVVVLDESVVFAKTVELDKQGKPAALAEAFIEAMPFEVGTRAYLQVKRGNTLELFGTNVDIYENLSEALRLCGVSKVVAVTPSAAYPELTDKQLTRAVENFVTTSEVHGQYNFADSDPV